MWNSIKRQFRVQRDDWVIDKVLIAGGTVFGVLLLWLITTLDSSVDSCFQVGTILSSLIAAVYLFINMAGGMKTYFNMEIGMGSTRRQFIVSYFTAAVVNAFVEVFVIAVLSVAEKWLYGMIYPTLLLEIDLTPYVLHWGIPVALAVIAVGALWCALLMRFGRKIFWLAGFYGCSCVSCCRGCRVHMRKRRTRFSAESAACCLGRSRLCREICGS